MKHSISKLRNLYFGLINWGLGKRYNATFRQNLEYLQPVYKEKFNINLLEFLDNMSGVIDFEE